MITYKSGNLLESELQALTNTVNCVGIMGKGIASEFKSRYPSMFRDYVRRCQRKEVQPGIPYVYPEPVGASQLGLGMLADSETRESEHLIVNFPTKNHWRGNSRKEWIELGLANIVEQYRCWGVTSIAVPALGCSNGGLDWADIGPMMHEYLQPLDILVEIYVPPGVDAAAPFANHAELLLAHS